MLYRKFGNTDLEVSAIGFGGWPMGGTQYGTVDDSQEMRAVHRALEIGVTCFDNAAGYGLGHSERVMGKALAAHRQEVVLITKCGIQWNEEARRMERNGTREHVLASCEASLNNLGTDYIDLLLVHWPDVETPFEETMRALESLVQAGKVRHVGVSNFMPEMLDTCREHLPIVTNQVGYSLFERRIEADVMPYCERNGIGIMAYGSLAHGLLSGAMTRETSFQSWDWRATGHAFGMPFFAGDGHFELNVEAAERLREIAEGAGRTLPDLALAWVISHPVVATALVGFRNADEVDGAANAAEWQIPADIMAEVEAVSNEAFERLAAAQNLSPEKGGWNPWNRSPTRFAGGGKASPDEQAPD